MSENKVNGWKKEEAFLVEMIAGSRFQLVERIVVERRLGVIKEGQKRDVFHD